MEESCSCCWTSQDSVQHSSSCSLNKTMLEDFLTLAEMKDGISIVVWVVSEIQKLKDVVALNKAEALLGCCKHFVRLNGVLGI